MCGEFLGLPTVVEIIVDNNATVTWHGIMDSRELYN